MEHILFLNKASFPANNITLACELFTDSIQGVLELNKGDDRFTLYLDSNELRLNEFELATGFTYSDYLQKLNDNGDVDLLVFLAEFEDKSPALNFISDEELDEASSYKFYMPEYATSDSESDLFGLTWALSATLLSILTDDRWNNIKLKIARTTTGEYIGDELWLENIACYQHGVQLKEERSNQDITNICCDHKVSDEFLAWYNSISEENKSRVVSKLKLSCERSFSGGKPLFDTLSNANGIREIRLSAYPGGAIRILFKTLGLATQHILVGFIKKDDGEGYDVNIRRAEDIYNG